MSMPRQQEQKFTVGFYKDHHGNTRPITKSSAQLNRTKVVQHPQQFRGVNPQVAAEREKMMRERQRAQVDGNLNKMNNLCQTLNKNLEQRGREMEDLKGQYDQMQVQDPRKAVTIQNQMNRQLFVVQSLAKKRDAVQAKIRELEAMKSKL
jgi:hypothetical protein